MAERASILQRAILCSSIIQSVSESGGAGCSSCRASQDSSVAACLSIL